MEKFPTICELPICQRPREKAFEYGVENLSDCELLCILIGSGGRGNSALELANSLLTRFKNLRKLSTVSLLELQKFRGIGKIKSLEIKACLEIARRFQQISLKPGTLLNRSRQVFACYHEKLRDKKKENFFSLLLDTKNRVIREELVSIGSLNCAIVHPREVFAPALRETAAGILLLHNHPSGDPAPSREDIEITLRLCEVGHLVGIEVLDHIIIGNGCYISFQEQTIPPFSRK